eukprot:5763161-Pyramimonas_sp.AAC.1
MRRALLDFCGLWGIRMENTFGQRRVTYTSSMGVEKVLDYVGANSRLRRQELTIGWMLPSEVGRAWAEHPCSRYERA